LVAESGFNAARGVALMAEQQEQYTFDRVVRGVLGVLAVTAAILLVRYLKDVLLPFVAAVILAYLLNPIVSALERKTGRRGLAVALTLGGLGIAGLGLTVVIVPLMISQIGRFTDDLKLLYKDLPAVGPSSDELPDRPAAIPESEPHEDGGSAKTAIGWQELKDAWERYQAEQDTPRSQRLAAFRARLEGTYIGGALERVLAYLQSPEFSMLLVAGAKRLAAGGWEVVTFTVNLVLGLIGLVIVLLYLVFLLLDFPAYAQAWPGFLPPRYRPQIVEFSDEFRVVMSRYFRGQAIVALLVGALFSVGFTVIGLPMAVPFGLFVGLLNMVPYLQTTALIPAMMLALMRAIEGSASFMWSVVLVLVVFGVVQVIQDGIIVPKVMGGTTGLRPVAILLGLFIWGKLLGFLGLLLAIPLTCLGIAYYRRHVLDHVEVRAIAPDG
jgi:predicted PurR-regulated permease PerM